MLPLVVPLVVDVSLPADFAPWWQAPDPCPDGGELRVSEGRSVWCQLGPVPHGPVARFDQGRLIESGEHRQGEKHGWWTRWDWSTGAPRARRRTLYWMGRDQPELDAPGGFLVGQDLSDLPVELDGATTTLSAIPGPLVLEVWFTGCGPCIAAFPTVAGLAERLAGRGTVVLLATDTERELVARFWARRGGPLPGVVHAWTGAGFGGMTQAGGFTFVLDADHRVVGTGDLHPPPDDRWERAIDALRR
jgi:thiol-disulfide isomerase/thioredoxin